jgi:hypothetical protein
MKRRKIHPTSPTGGPRNLTASNSKKMEFFIFCIGSFCALCLFSGPACQPNRSGPPSSTRERLVSATNNETNIPADDALKSSQCDSLAGRIDELSAVILRQEQAVNQAAAQSRESCQGESALECGFWTDRVNRLNDQLRKLRQQLQKLTNQRSDGGCAP